MSHRIDIPSARSTSQSGTYQPLTDAQVWERIDELPARPFDSDAAVRMSIVEGHAPTLVVTRFARQMNGGSPVRRIHQEDMCQALGIPPEIKYGERQGNSRQPSYERFAGIIERWADGPRVEHARLLEHMTVSLALGDTDAHAKNTSVFNDPGGTVRVTPMYDVAPTLTFIRQRHFGMPVAGRFVITEITREHLVREASSWGMPERLARHTVERTLSAMRGAVSAADAAHRGLRADVRAASLEQLERVSRS